MIDSFTNGEVVGVSLLLLLLQRLLTSPSLFLCSLITAMLSPVTQKTYGRHLTEKDGIKKQKSK